MQLDTVWNGAAAGANRGLLLVGCDIPRDPPPPPPVVARVRLVRVRPLEPRAWAILAAVPATWTPLPVIRVASGQPVPVVQATLRRLRARGYLESRHAESVTWDKRWATLYRRVR